MLSTFLLWNQWFFKQLYFTYEILLLLMTFLTVRLPFRDSCLQLLLEVMVFLLQIVNFFPQYPLPLSPLPHTLPQRLDHLMIIISLCRYLPSPHITFLTFINYHCLWCFVIPFLVVVHVDIHIFDVTGENLSSWSSRTIFLVVGMGPAGRTGVEIGRPPENGKKLFKRMRFNRIDLVLISRCAKTGMVVFFAIGNPGRFLIPRTVGVQIHKRPGVDFRLLRKSVALWLHIFEEIPHISFVLLPLSAFLHNV